MYRIVKGWCPRLPLGAVSRAFLMRIFLVIKSLRYCTLYGAGHSCKEADRNFTRQGIISMCTAIAYSSRQSVER